MYGKNVFASEAILNEVHWENWENQLLDNLGITRPVQHGLYFWQVREHTLRNGHSPPIERLIQSENTPRPEYQYEQDRNDHPVTSKERPVERVNGIQDDDKGETKEYGSTEVRLRLVPVAMLCSSRIGMSVVRL